MQRHSFEHRRPTTRMLVASGVVMLGVAGCSGPDAYTFVETLGTDTTAIETFSRTGDRIEGRLLQRWSRTTMTEYQADLDPDGMISQFTYTTSIPGENPEGTEPMTVSFRFDGDRATVVRGGDTAVVDAPRGTVPLMNKPGFSYAIHHQVALQAATGADSVPLAFLRAGRPGTEDNALLRYSGDSAAMSYFGNPLVVKYDDAGTVAGIDGARTTMKVSGMRVTDPVPLDELATEYAARDARGEGMGVASPRAGVEASVGRASFSVDYSRPAKRGREIFGSLVPYHAVWRTGANSATHISFDRDIELGGTRIAAGTYTMWTTFTTDDATLIINRQTQQWGTAYDESQDLVRLPLAHEELGEVVERFTIAINETGTNQGELSLAWDRSRFSIPIRVR